jgi:hypothetical protein
VWTRGAAGQTNTSRGVCCTTIDLTHASLNPDARAPGLTGATAASPSVNQLTSKIIDMVGDMAMISLLGRHSFLLSSSTVFMFSICSAAGGEDSDTFEGATAVTLASLESDTSSQKQAMPCELTQRASTGPSSTNHLRFGEGSAARARKATPSTPSFHSCVVLSASPARTNGAA